MDNENKPSFMFDDRYNQNPIKAKYRIDHDDPTKFDLKCDQIKILLYLLIIPLIMLVLVLLIKINPGNRIDFSAIESEKWYVLVKELISAAIGIPLMLFIASLTAGIGLIYLFFVLFYNIPIVLLLMICPPVLIFNVAILEILTEEYMTWFAQKCIVNGKYKTWTSYVLNNVDPAQKSKHLKSINLIATVFAVGLFFLILIELKHHNYVFLSVCVLFSIVPTFLYYYGISLKMSPDYLYITDDIEIAIGYRRKIEYEKKQKKEEKKQKEKEEKEKKEKEKQKKRLEQELAASARASKEERGRVGEKAVNYRLKWWEAQVKDRNKDFVVYTVSSDCTSKYSDHCILLKSMEEGLAVSEPQEFDHLICTSKGIISIETKNYQGEIEIVNDGSWLHNQTMIASPYPQVQRHNLILRKIFQDYTVPIHSFVCIANEHTIIKGTENTKLDIVSIRDLEGYLDQIVEDTTITLSKQGVYNCLMLINAAKVKSD